MKKAIILSSLFFLSLFTFAQKQSIELDLAGKYGVQAKSEQSPFGLPLYTVKISGSSASAGLNYKRMLNKKLFIKAGAGYYRLAADHVKIQDGNVTWKDRAFSPDKGWSEVYNTTKYHYNNLMFTAGAGYEQGLAKNLKFTFGGDIVYLYSLSQRYYIGPAAGRQKYATHEQFPLALGFNANAGVLYKLKNSKFYLNPKIVLPVYQRMFADKNLLERNGGYHQPQKWFGGAGLSISVGKHF